METPIPSFKDICRNDITSSFLDPEVFGEEHMVDGKAVVIVLDDMENIEREKLMRSHMDGIYARQILFYVNADDLGGTLPARGRIMTLDGKKYTVVEATDESGVYAVTLEANRSR